MRGMLVHRDASKHAWLEGQPALDLVITLDDATSELLSAFLVPEENTRSSFQGLVEVVARHGLFMELYTDRGSHYFVTPEAGGRVSTTQLTQVGRALKQLGIGHIAAYSLEARGRCERAFRTLQDRLPKEFALARITTLEAANRFIGEVYLARHNARFAVPAEEPASAFVEVPEALWRDVLCLQEERRVGNDNCVHWRGRVVQIPPTPLRPQRLASFAPAARADFEETWRRDHRDAAKPGGSVDNAARCPRAPQAPPPQPRSIHALPNMDKTTRALQ